MLSVAPFTSVLALCGLSAALGLGMHSKRTSTLDTTIYAYGTNISGLPIFYGDGAYSIQLTGQNNGR